MKKGGKPEGEFNQAAWRMIAGQLRISENEMQKLFDFNNVNEIHKIVEENFKEFDLYQKLYKQDNEGGKGEYYFNKPQALLLSMFGKNIRCMSARGVMIAHFLDDGGSQNENF
jgi:hypothetical protein